MGNKVSNPETLTIDDLMRAESEVLDRIAREVDGEAGSMVAGFHTSHSSGHSSTGGHFSTVARVEELVPESEAAAAEKPK